MQERVLGAKEVHSSSIRCASASSSLMHDCRAGRSGACSETSWHTASLSPPPTTKRRSMKIYTRTGDSGTSCLYSGERADKDTATFHALGDVDEVNSTLGVAREYARQLDPRLAAQVGGRKGARVGGCRPGRRALPRGWGG